MTPLPIKLTATVGVTILGLAAALAVTERPARHATPRASARAPVEPHPAPHVNVLAGLGLDDTQREQIEGLRARERPGVEVLQRAIVATERELRMEELAQPFDAERVNTLVALQAELTAHLRGAESRVVSEISEILTSEQRRRFAELRAADVPAAPGVTAAPPSPSAGGRRVIPWGI